MTVEWNNNDGGWSGSADSVYSRNGGVGMADSQEKEKDTGRKISYL